MFLHQMRPVEAKRRFLAGLPPRHTFFVTALLADSRGRHEQVFVVVDSIIGSKVRGRIWSEIGVVEGYRLGQPYALDERDLLDWMVARSDGTEEGKRGRAVHRYVSAVGDLHVEVGNVEVTAAV